jgi:hypothetical protein
LFFSRDRVRDRTRKSTEQLGGGAIAVGTTDEKTASVDGP